VCSPGLLCVVRAAGLALAVCFVKECPLLNRFNTAILRNVPFMRKL
jgi:hypothetical protein